MCRLAVLADYLLVLMALLRAESKENKLVHMPESYNVNIQGYSIKSSNIKRLHYNDLILGLVYNYVMLVLVYKLRNIRISI